MAAPLTGSWVGERDVPQRGLCGLGSDLPGPGGARSAGTLRRSEGQRCVG